MTMMYLNMMSDDGQRSGDPKQDLFNYLLRFLLLFPPPPFFFWGGEGGGAANGTVGEWGWVGGVRQVF